MTHAFITADAIHAAIERHRAAYAAFQAAPEGRPSIIANDEYDAASDALVWTACTTRFGALALIEHLRWWLRDEAEFKDGHQPAYGTAETRVADLALFFGTRSSVTAIPSAAPSGRLAPVATTRPLPAIDRQHRGAPGAMRDEPLPGAIDPWEAVTPVRPDTAHCRAPRFLDLAGEALAAVAIIAGGMIVTGLATLL